MAKKHATKGFLTRAEVFALGVTKPVAVVGAGVGSDPNFQVADCENGRIVGFKGLASSERNGLVNQLQLICEIAK